MFLILTYAAIRALQSLGVINKALHCVLSMQYGNLMNVEMLSIILQDRQFIVMD